MHGVDAARGSAPLDTHAFADGTRNPVNLKVGLRIVRIEIGNIRFQYGVPKIGRQRFGDGVGRSAEMDVFPPVGYAVAVRVFGFGGEAALKFQHIDAAVRESGVVDHDGDMPVPVRDNVGEDEGLARVVVGVHCLADPVHGVSGFRAIVLGAATEYRDARDPDPRHVRESYDAIHAAVRAEEVALRGGGIEGVVIGRVG